MARKEQRRGTEIRKIAGSLSPPGPDYRLTEQSPDEP
ncbi:hypothetical protein F441_11887 [Phytophthora nicotianae CJ01A1]|uniref:Uncharacterized protein n=1 Tax=Phytophthora nicotianae CJ01A1 TaxID=1317063 RepID=W2WTA2_PHYNI|nr:hypothetical protein F441_11887 [Phytophthora nicotianae CJ01A1]